MTIMQVMHENHYRFSDDVMIFVQAAGEMHPTIFSASMYDNYVGLIIKNATWSGMWDFLKSYFMEKHNATITK